MSNHSCLFLWRLAVIRHWHTSRWSDEPRLQHALSKSTWWLAGSMCCFKAIARALQGLLSALECALSLCQQFGGSARCIPALRFKVQLQTHSVKLHVKRHRDVEFMLNP